MRMPRPDLFAVDAAGLRARLRLTGIAAGSFLAAVPALLLLILTTVSMALTPVVVGGVLLLGLVPALSAYAGVRRRVTGALVGRDLSAGHRPAGPEPVRRLLTWARDERRWRDYATVAFCVTGGWALDLLAVAAFVAPFDLLVLPTLWGGWFALMLLGVPLAVALWWILTPILVPVRFEVEAAILGGSRSAELEAEVERVSAARSESIDHSAAELRRIERDLHDGAQARMVSLGMNLGLAEELLLTDPEAAAKLLAEAREVNLSALSDLRSVVRGILPPVLADRGLVGALEALALDVAVPVTVRGSLAGRPPAPVESALYFAVAEALANVVKHASARQAWVDLGHSASVVRVVVRDDGVGGADVSVGTGLAGVSRRLSVFDGCCVVDSPVGGPTTVAFAVPCELGDVPGS